MDRTFVRVVSGLAALAALGACGLVPQAASLAVSPSEVDFGQVVAGGTVTRKVTLTHQGSGPLTVGGVRALEGDLGGVWSIAGAPVTVLPGEQAELTLTFAPPASLAAGSQALRLEVLVEGLPAGESPPAIQALGEVVAPVCDVPSALAFGSVARGDSFEQRILLTNSLPVPVTTFVGDLTSSGSDANAFTLGEGSGGEVVLEPGETRVVAVTFRPVDNLTYTAFLSVFASEGCAEQKVMLTGTGVDTPLEWNPTNVDCGYVTPGARATRTVTFTNHSMTDILLSNIHTQNTSEFGRVPEGGLNPAELLVPAEGTAALTLFCEPVALGPRQTTLTFGTSLSSQPAGQISLTVRGGGPDIEVSPSPLLDFGKVASFEGVNPPSFSKRTLTVRNVGTAPAVADNKANLRLGAPDQNGEPTQPYFVVQPLNSETAATEFQVTMPASYNPQKGLAARVGENELGLSVTFSAISVGVKEVKVTIFSNDGDEPAVEVTLRAESVALPPCHYTLSASQLQFGEVSAPEHKELTFSLRNDGTAPDETCLVHGPELDAHSHPFFSLVEAPSAFELEPGEVRHFRVRVRPSGQTPASITPVIGALDFFVSSPTAPQAQIGLAATVGQSCIAFAPNVLQMGEVPLSCGGRTQEVTVLNLCDQPLTLPAPVLMGSSAFSFAQPPPNPISLAAYGSATFEVTYTPTGEHSDHSLLSIVGTHNGANVTWVLPLNGRGTSAAQLTETFSIAQQPKTDLLMVLDPTCNAGYLAGLADGATHLLDSALFAHTDLRVGVVNAVIDSGTPVGQLVYGPTHPEKFLTPGTPDFVNKLKTKIQLPPTGSTESCLQMALTAVTNPLVSNGNAGFLRPDAHLAVMCLTDAPDQSAPSAEWYLHRFLNLKGPRDRNAFSFSAIAGFDPAPATGCGYDGGPDDGRLAHLVEQTHGLRMEVCSYAPDYTGFMLDLGMFTSRSSAPFFLNGTPDVSAGPSALNVAVDGLVIPETYNGTTLWTYDAAKRVLAFTPGYNPEPGQTLTVSYAPICAP